MKFKIINNKIMRNEIIEYGSTMLEYENMKIIEHIGIEYFGKVSVVALREKLSDIFFNEVTINGIHYIFYEFQLLLGNPILYRSVAVPEAVGYEYGNELILVDRIQ